MQWMLFQVCSSWYTEDMDHFLLPCKMKQNRCYCHGYNYKRPHRRLCVSPMKLKLSLTDSLCYSESIYVSFNLNKLMPLHLWPPLGEIHERKWGKAKKINVYNRQEIHTLQKTRVLCSLGILFKRFALLY